MEILVIMADHVLNVISTQDFLEVQASHARVAPPILPITGFLYGFKITFIPCTELGGPLKNIFLKNKTQ